MIAGVFLWVGKWNAMILDVCLLHLSDANDIAKILDLIISGLRLALILSGTVFLVR